MMSNEQMLVSSITVVTANNPERNTRRW